MENKQSNSGHKPKHGIELVILAKWPKSGHVVKLIFGC
jgi:hypothetical protein